ncbi:DegT/DnrJ/EryC1/StrS family aminotransferase [Gracilibacillus kekensis]|uniref:Pyridoxal phosphate-dependent aminotransferase EpsN n=1 Tax=Gracilibacillus kekensis TaxID=1027249 RepID=A0A1M7K6R7_9BACI|nr:aminotransferase class I/II-fold pyridoxal phosphate-dependent enzyme [Gracilibacillus kekensis]SHM60980.1 pyridoxal phosphate-dependent aminotransferase EpsN [Gracilibacillus kekensis]
MSERILLSPPHMSGNERKYIDYAFDSNWVAPLGPNVDSFEKEMADYIGVSDATAVSSGTAGIHLALELLEVKKDDLVFCSSLTFIASANPILYLKAQPVFIDSEPETWNMSPTALRKALEDAEKNNKLPKAIIVVNLYGQSADMNEILTICEQYNVPIIEDAAESLGAEYYGKKSGSFGTIGIFSFNGNKIITTSGGGMMVSNDSYYMEKAKFLATQARDKAIHYQHSHVGYNYRLSNILAGVGRAQLEVLDSRIERRREIFNKYKGELTQINGIKFMPEPKDYYSTRWLTTLTLNPQLVRKNYMELIDLLNKENVEARPIWKPLHEQPLFKDNLYYPHSTDSFSNKVFDTGICLPSGSSLTNEQQDKVIDIIKTALT